MAGVNDWRFRLAEEEDRRRRKFGWDDLLGLLQTAAGIGTSIAGLKQSGERQALAQEQFDYGKGQDVLDAERQARLDARAQEQHETGMHDKGYFQPAPAMQGPMPATAQTTSTGMTRLPEYDEAREFRQGLDQAQQISEAAEARGGAPGQVFGGDQWHYPPGYGQAAGGGNYDPLDAQRLEVMTEQEMMRRYPDAPRGMDGELMYTDEMRAERATVMDGFKAQFGYAAPPPDEPEPSYGAVYMEMAADFNSSDPAIRARAEAEWPEFLQGDPEGAAIVTLLRQNPGALQAAPGQSDWGALGFEAEPTPGMVEAQLAETGQGLYRQQTDEGLGWSDPEKKATHDALTELLRRLRAEAYRTQQSASPMRPPVIPPFDRRF